MTWKYTFLVVTGCALVGMVLGGLFGLAAALISRDLAYNMLPWKDGDPVGATCVIGATIGVLLGGGLGCFGILVELGTRWRAGGPPETHKGRSVHDLD